MKREKRHERCERRRVHLWTILVATRDDVAALARRIEALEVKTKRRKR